jgi:hypothetical protein
MSVTLVILYAIVGVISAYYMTKAMFKGDIEDDDVIGVMIDIITFIVFAICWLFLAIVALVFSIIYLITRGLMYAIR